MIVFNRVMQYSGEVWASLRSTTPRLRPKKKKYLYFEKRKIRLCEIY